MFISNSVSRLLATLTLFGIICHVSSDFSQLTELSGKDVTGEVFGHGDKKNSVFPAAYGDINSDKLTDVVTIAKNQSSIIIYFGYEEPPLLRQAVSCHITTNKSGKPGKVSISGVSLGDFTGDGLIDILVSFNQEGRPDFTEVMVFKGLGTDIHCDSDEGPQTIEMVQEPLILDLNGDMIMDLLGEVWVKPPPNDTNNKTKQRTIWISTPVDNQPKFAASNFTMTDNSPLRPMTIPSSNAFVDINGDLVPEVVILTKDHFNTTKFTRGRNENHPQVSVFAEYYKIIIDKHGKIMFAKARDSVLLDDKNSTHVFGQSIFMDLNQNGRLFHLLPFCSSAAHRCGQGNSNQGIKAIYDGNVTELHMNFKNGMGFFMESKDQKIKGWDYHYAKTITLRAGDYNLDGYPDLIGVLDMGKNGTVSLTKAVIFENVACVTDASESKQCDNARTFKINYDVLQQYTNAVLATFYDILEDGLIDVIIVKSNGLQSPNDAYEVRAFQNSPDYDANFMKVMVLTGLKCPKCPKSEIPYGNIIPGPVISYKTTTQAGISQTAVAAQYYRSSFMPMDLPCTIFGIGHSPNFIETLHVSLGNSNMYNESHFWPQIIPNSQIIVVPSPLHNPKQWKAKLFLTPSKAVLNTFGVLVGFCLVITSIVLALQYKERREDRKDKLNEARQFHMM